MYGKMRFEESKILNKWVALHCNNLDVLKGKHRQQKEKPRCGNKFLVVGANTYLGWATVCQLAHKFPGCEIVCVDDSFSSYGVMYLTTTYPIDERIKTLKKYFNVTCRYEKIDYSNYIDISKHLHFNEEDIIIFLKNNETGFLNFMRANETAFRVPFLYTDSIYTIPYKYISQEFPILNIKYGSIIGTFNLLTLVDKKLSPCNVHSTPLNHLIQQAITCKEIYLSEEQEYYRVTSLENITRAIVKSIRKGWEGTTILDAVESETGPHTFAKIIINTMKKYYGIEVECNIKNLNTSIFIQERFRKQVDYYRKYIDKFRISIRDTVAYSTINTIEDNNTEIHKGQVFNKMKNGKIVKQPSGDYKHFAIQKYPSSISKYFMGDGFPTKKFITKKTNIISIGSCFAMEIGKYLRNQGYNYPVYEKGSGEFNANWGIVFNSASIRQIVEDAFDLFNPWERFWEREEGYMQDMFRRNTVYPKGKHEDKLQEHRKKSREAISKAEVLIATLGLTEVWRDRRDRATFWRVPPMSCYDPVKHEFYVMNVNDVYSDLFLIKGVLKMHNPECKLIVTVSPVPFQATYREDCDVVSANVYSKAVSCVAANQFCSEYRNDGVYYFPSFEFVRYGFENPYIDDGRHIKRPVVNKMMKFFEKTFVKGE